MRLPSKVADIVASTRCNGFYLRFDIPDYAEEWRKALYVWKRFEGNKAHLYVERDMGSRRLNNLLGLNVAEPQCLVPDHAIHSVQMQERKWIPRQDHN